MNTHEKYIKKCIELAHQAEGLVAPNPLVGSIVLDENNKFAGEGFHQKYGEAHAEVNALNMAGDKAKNGTLYVSLEPCSHFGKTPPCADLIIKKGIKKLIVGMVDPNPKVSGEGIKKCQKAGIEVITGILESECKKLNEIFIKNIKYQKPFIAIKTACTLDGKIATKTGSSKWITSSKSREKVQSLRNKYDAILTGSGTILADNPSLNCRMANGRNPIRIIIDSNLITPTSAKVYTNDKTRVIIATSKNADKSKLQKYPDHIEFLKCEFSDNNKINLNNLIKELYKKNITSILIEAGGILNGAFIKEKLVDKIYMFSAPKILGDNKAKSWIEGFDIDQINDCLNLKLEETIFLDPDILTIYRF